MRGNLCVFWVAWAGRFFLVRHFLCNRRSEQIPWPLVVPCVAGNSTQCQEGNPVSCLMWKNYFPGDNSSLQCNIYSTKKEVSCSSDGKGFQGRKRREEMMENTSLMQHLKEDAQMSHSKYRESKTHLHWAVMSITSRASSSHSDKLRTQVTERWRWIQCGLFLLAFVVTTTDSVPLFSLQETWD